MNRLLLSLFVVLLSGCMYVHPAGGSASTRTGRDPAAEMDRTVWPQRWGDDRPGLGKGVVVPIDGPLSAWEPARHGHWHHRLPDSTSDEAVRALAVGRTDDAGYRFRMEGFGAFVFLRDPDIPVPDGESQDRDEPAFMFVFTSGRVDKSKPGEPHVDIDRTWFAYYDHRRGGRAEPDDAGNGVVMLMPGLFGVPEKVMEIMVSTMRQHGWNVVRMLAPPARFVERMDIVLDPEDESTAHEAATELMHRIAETAYAAEGAMGYVLDQRPALRARPKVLLGGSAGAMSLPAAMMRDPDTYDAAVLIAGGSNILDIVSRSTYTKPIGALEFTWAGLPEGDVPPRDVLDRFTARYLEHAPLDGHNAAGAFVGKPVLMLHASADEAVPADSGDRLWSSLGEPERWVIQGNHMTLFLSLWLHTPRIMTWLDEHVPGVSP